MLSEELETYIEDLQHIDVLYFPQVNKALVHFIVIYDVDYCEQPETVFKNVAH